MHPDVHNSAVYNSQVLETAKVPISKWVDQKTVVHLHNGIIAAERGSLTFCHGTSETREYYAKWNKPAGERQIPYGLT